MFHCVSGTVFCPRNEKMAKAQNKHIGNVGIVGKEWVDGKYACKEHSAAWHCSPSWWQRVAGSAGRVRAGRRRIQCELVRGWHSPLCPTLLSNVSGAQLLLCSLCLCVSIREKSSFIIDFEKNFKNHKLKVNGLMFFWYCLCAHIYMYVLYY